MSLSNSNKTTLETTEHSNIFCSGRAAAYNNTIYCSNVSATTIFDGTVPTKITTQNHTVTPRVCICQNFLVVLGFEKGAAAKLYAMNLQNQTWSILPALGNVPNSRANSSIICLDDVYLVIFGGFSDGYCGDMHKYCLATRHWQPIQAASSQEPKSRYAFAYAYRKACRELWIHGGATTPSDNWDDLWQFSFNSNTWTCIFPKRNINNGCLQHHMAFHGSDRLFFVTNGYELQEYDIAANTWHANQLAFSLDDHSFVSFQDKLVFCGSRGIISICVGPALDRLTQRFHESLFAKYKHQVKTDLVIKFK